MDTITGNVIELSAKKVSTILSLLELLELDFNNKEDTNTSCSIINSLYFDRIFDLLWFIGGQNDWVVLSNLFVFFSLLVFSSNCLSGVEISFIDFDVESSFIFVSVFCCF